MNLWSSRPLKSPNCVQLAFKSCISARERMSFSRETNPLLFSWLLWSSNWKTRFLQCGWFCKQRAKTKLRIRLQKLKKGRLPDRMKWDAGQREWEWTRKCDQCMFDVLRKKAKYPKKFRKVPGLQCEGAACSQGLDIHLADRLKNFQTSPLSHHFHFLHIFDSAKRSTAQTEFQPSPEAPGLKILMLGLCPEDKRE